MTLVPTFPPPASPVLVITLQKQSSTVDAAHARLWHTPYVGLQVSDFEGYGAPSANPFNLPGIAGAFGSTINVYQVFTNGQAGGSAGFSTNDNVGNRPALLKTTATRSLRSRPTFRRD